MIRLINVSKYYVTPFGRHYIFRDVTLDLPLDKNIGVIGPNGAGKSTFLRLLGGADRPSTGTIVKYGSISPPMGLTPVLQKSLSALENVRFAGRIYGMKKPEVDRMIDFVRDLAKIGYYFEMPVSTYSAGMRQKVAFGINMSMQFDYYLFDEISAGGDRDFRKMAKAMVAERLRTSRFIMTSHDTGELLELCDSGIVIRDGTLTYFDDIREAAVFYGDIEEDEAGARKPRRKRASRKEGKTEDTSGTADAGTAVAIAGAGRLKKRKRRAAVEQGESGETAPALPPVAQAVGATGADGEPGSATQRARPRKARSRREDASGGAAAEADQLAKGKRRKPGQSAVSAKAGKARPVKGKPVSRRRKQADAVALAGTAEERKMARRRARAAKIGPAGVKARPARKVKLRKTIAAPRTAESQPTIALFAGSAPTKARGT